jgi:hypothetical protein
MVNLLITTLYPLQRRSMLTSPGLGQLADYAAVTQHTPRVHVLVPNSMVTFAAHSIINGYWLTRGKEK